MSQKIDQDHEKLIETEICTWLASYLNCPISNIDIEKHFVDYGIDSISSIKMLHMLEKHANTTLEAYVIQDHPSITKLTSYIISLMHNRNIALNVMTDYPVSASNQEIDSSNTENIVFPDYL